MEQAGAASPHLGGSEKQQAADHAPLRGLVIHEIIREQGEHELKRRASALFWSALAAGLSMGLSFMAVVWMRAALPEATWRHLITSIGYTAGFVAVVLGRQQLFTESTLTAVLPVLTHRDGKSFAALLRLWAVVLTGNIAGTWLIAAALNLSGVFEADVYKAMAETGREALGHGVWPTFVKAVFAGWIIALMVWLLPSSRSARLWVIVFMTWLIALGKLSHIIAGSSEAAWMVLSGHAYLGEYLGRFFLPTLIGNVLGGITLVALLNHAPFSDEVRNAAPEGEHGPMSGA